MKLGKRKALKKEDGGVMFSRFPYKILRIGSGSHGQINAAKFCSGKQASEHEEWDLGLFLCSW